LGNLLAAGDEHVGRPVEALAPKPCRGKAVAALGVDDLGDGGLIGLGGRGGEGERHFGEAQLEQAIAAAGLAVVVALRRGPAEDLDLTVVQAEAPIDGGDLRLQRPLVGQEQARRTALDDRGRDGAAVDIRKRLRGKYYARVLLPQRLQPLPELAGEPVIVEREPAFVDNEQRGAPIEPILDAVEEVRQDSRRRACPDQPFGFEGLDIRLAEALRFRVEQSSPGTPDRIGLQGLLQRVRLQQDRKARDCPLRHGCGGKRGQRRP